MSVQNPEMFRRTDDDIDVSHKTLSITGKLHVKDLLFNYC